MWSERFIFIIYLGLFTLSYPLLSNSRWTKASYYQFYVRKKFKDLPDEDCKFKLRAVTIWILKKTRTAEVAPK